MLNKLAVQLYTLRDACANDFPGVLRKLKEMGWAGVQMAGYHGWDPQELAELVRKEGLQTAGLHVGLDRASGELEQLIQEARWFGTKDIVVSSTPQPLRTTEGYREAKRQLIEAGRKLAAEGLRLSYHNHAFEYEVEVEGRSALEYLLEPVAENPILAELDVYWVKKGGHDPASFIRSYSGRMPIIHLKDMTNDSEPTFAEIGTGSIAFEPILAWGEANGVEWYVVEQDRCPREPMDCVANSLSNLKRLIAEGQPAQ